MIMEEEELDSIKLKPFLETAHIWAKSSSCCRLHVGAVIFNIKTKRLLSIGYNGTMTGKVHCNMLFECYANENRFYVNGKINKFLDDTGINTNYMWHRVKEHKFKELHHRFSELYEVHAEQNAIYNLIKTGASYDTDNLAIISTVEPCAQCAKAIAALGIKYVFYEEEYDRSIADIPEYFSICDIICRQVQSDGKNL